VLANIPVDCAVDLGREEPSKFDRRRILTLRPEALKAQNDEIRLLLHRDPDTPAQRHQRRRAEKAVEPIIVTSPTAST
jgi:hypothetical protein